MGTSQADFIKLPFDVCQSQIFLLLHSAKILTMMIVIMGIFEAAVTPYVNYQVSRCQGVVS